MSNNTDYRLISLLKSYRKADLTALKRLAERTLSALSQPEMSVRDKALIAYEIAKAYRLLGNHEKAAALADTTIANVPPGSLDLFAALQRLRSFIYLDQKNYRKAEEYARSSDGIEMSLYGGESRNYRNDSAVSCETWLLSVEIALTQGKINDAAEFISFADSKLAGEKRSLDKKSLSLLDKKNLGFRIEYLSVQLDVFTKLLEIQNGGDKVAALSSIDQYRRQFLSALSSGDLKSPFLNRPFLLKLNALLGVSNSDEPQINPLELERWKTFSDFIEPLTESEENEESVENALVPLSRFVSATDAVSQTAEQTNSGDALSRIADLLERFADTGLMAGNNFQKQPNGSSSSFMDKNAAFGGQLLTLDLAAFLFNCKNQSFTGYILLQWYPDIYQSAIVLGGLSKIVLTGEAYLFLDNGSVIDVCVGETKPSADAEQAKSNLEFVVQMAFSLGLGGEISPKNIYGNAIKAEQVAQRPHYIEVDHESLINYLTSVENRLAGIENEPEDVFMDEDFDIFGSNDVSRLEKDQEIGVQDKEKLGICNDAELEELLG